MANMVYHELYCEGIKQKLIELGVVYEKSLTSRSAPNGRIYPHVLDYNKCNSEEWQKELSKILKDGVVDCAEKNEDGTYGVRRDYTPEEQSELGFYPVNFSEDGNKMSWLCRYISNEDPAFYASSALPDEIMIMTEVYEGEYDGGCYLKAGQKIADKPTAPLVGANGNIFNLIGIASNILKEFDLADQATKMQKRVTACELYEEALRVIADYVDFGAASET